MILLMLSRRINYSYSTADANLKLGVAYPALRIFGYYSIWQIKGVTLSLFQEEESCFRLAMHEESSTRRKADDNVHDGAIPAYLLDRDETTRAKVLSNTIKQKRKEKAGKWDVPLPKVRPIAEDEMFKVIRTGKKKTKQWKRMITKVTFVGQSFTRKPPTLQ